ncbi:MAG: hypothetical protein R3C40_09980 [Parvularculaceae bacterium]
MTKPTQRRFRISGRVKKRAGVFDGGYYHVKCDYRLLIDNLMDLTHEAHVHPSSIGQAELREAPIDTKVDGDRIIVSRWMANVEPPSFLAKRYQKRWRSQSLANL